MKKLARLFTTATLAVTVLAASGIVFAAELPFGSAGALDDDSYTLGEMLTYAIQDEYAAKAEYAAIIETYGTTRPYSNIVKAENRHISALLPLFETYDIVVPEDDADGRVTVPGSLQESYVIGVEAEIRNIEMYESFLKENLPDDVRIVFENLKRASESHLRAFENAAEGQIQNGMSRARRSSLVKGNGSPGMNRTAGQRLGNYLGDGTRECIIK